MNPFVDFVLVRVTMADLTSELYRSGPAFSSSFVDLWISTTQLELNEDLPSLVDSDGRLHIIIVADLRFSFIIGVANIFFLLFAVWDRGLTTVIPHQLLTPLLF